MTVKQHNNGDLYCRFQINGERKHLKCTGATSKREAEQMEASFMHKLQQQQNGVIPREEKKCQLTSSVINFFNILN